MADNINQYNVNWNLTVNTTTALRSLSRYSSAVKSATEAAIKLRNVSRTMLNPASGGGGRAVVGSGNKTSSYVGGSNAGKGSSQPSRPSTNQKTTAPAGGRGGRTVIATPRARGRGNMSVSESFKNPLRNTPFVGLMGTMMAYSAVSNETQKAVEYDNIMTTAKAILKTADDDLGTFEARFQKLSKNIRQIGIETKFTAKEVADATRYLAMAGLGTEAINASMRPIANLALIGDEDLGLIADLTTNIMTGYGLGSNSLGSVSDVITSVMTRSNVSITEIAESFKMSAGFLRAAGVDFNEATAAIGVLGDAGIKATMAGTALRAMSIRFANPSKQAREVLDSLGVDFMQKTDVMGKEVVKVRPLFEIFSDLKKAGATLQDMQKIFGTIGGNAAINLIDKADRIKELHQATLVSHGSADYVAKQKQDMTVSGRWAQLTSSFSEQFTKAFEMAKPQILDSLVKVTDAIMQPEFGKGVADLFNTISQLFGLFMQAGSWVMQNMTWIRPLLMTKFISSNIFNIARSITGLFGTIGGSLGVGAAMNMSRITSGLLGLTTGNVLAIVSTITGFIITANLEAKQFNNANTSAFDAINDNAPSVINSYHNITQSIQEAIEKATALRKLQSGGGSNDDETLEGSTGIISHSEWYSSRYIKDDLLNFLNPFNTMQTIYNDVTGLFGADPVWMTGANDPIPFDGQLRDQAKNIPLQLQALAKKDAKNVGDSFRSQLGYLIDPSRIQSHIQSMIDGKLDLPSNYDSSLYANTANGYVPSGVTTVGQGRKTIEYAYAYNKEVDAIVEAGEKYNEFMKSSDPAGLLVKEIPAVAGIMESLVYNKKTGLYHLPKIKDNASPQEIKDHQSITGYISEMFKELVKQGGGLESLFGSIGAHNVMSRVFGQDVMGVNPVVNPNTINTTNLYGDDGGSGAGSGSGGNGRTSGLVASRATPRQVIINIENMLKMDNVSVNEDNEGRTFNDFKDKLTQALLEVVSDTSASFHG